MVGTPTQHMVQPMRHHEPTLQYNADRASQQIPAPELFELSGLSGLFQAMNRVSQVITLSEETDGLADGITVQRLHQILSEGSEDRSRSVT